MASTPTGNAPGSSLQQLAARSISPPSPPRCACSGACMRDSGDEEGEGGALPRRRPPPQPPSPSSPSPSSSPPSMEGGKNKNKKGDIAKAIRDRLSFSSPGARLSCWGYMGTARHRIRRSWSRSGSGSGSRGGTAGGGLGTPVGLMATITSSCVCINGNPCRCRGTRNGKAAAVAAAAGIRSLVERNDFYCHECNTHTL